MEAFHASILSLNISGKAEQVLLRDIQWHPFKQQVLHVDFQRVDKNKKIHMKVPLHFINAEISPGVKVSGGIVSHILTEVDISCLPKDLPEFISVDLGEMTAGHSLHLSDLILLKKREQLLPQPLQKLVQLKGRKRKLNKKSTIFLLLKICRHFNECRQFLFCSLGCEFLNETDCRSWQSG